MKIIKAKTAGFCFGVDRAVQLTYGLLASGAKVATLGELIHNPQCVQDLAAKGAQVVSSVAEVPSGYEIVIRSHGVGKSVYDEIAAAKLTVHDATCPFVTKIHKLAQKASDADELLLIAGDASHPEVQGIMGHTSGEVLVFTSLEDLKSKFTAELYKKPCTIVAQTTFEVKNWLQCTEFLKKVCTNARFFDTICSATWTRQDEAEILSKKCDVVIVIGGAYSSNTQKLVSVAAAAARAYSVECAAQLDPAWFEDVNIAGVTAGASTPSSIIEEVLCRMSDIREEMGFEELLEATLKPVFAGKVVTGVVTSISANEIQVDIGTKHTGIVKLDDLTSDPNAKTEDLVKKGDEIELMVTKVDDKEGLAHLSKRRIDENKGREDMLAAVESGEAMDGYVTGVNRGGIDVLVKGVRVFVPRSHATLRQGDDLNALVRTNVKLVIKQCEGRNVVGSVREAMSRVNNELRDKFWASAAEGQEIAGVVKSLTSYGAFVDIGGVDGLLHISELSWSRIKHPSEVLSVGDNITVYIKSLDSENKKVSLGYKKAEDNPWQQLKDIEIGTVLNGTVVSLTKFGAFVRILPGIDGLVHISEISHDRVEKVSDVLNVGDTVQVKLTDVDFEKKRISLSMKALVEAPAKEEIAEDAE